MGISQAPMGATKAGNWVHIPYNKNDGDLAHEHYRNDEGKYIGSPESFETYNGRFGISQFETADEDDSVCSVGFNTAEQKWYGWSHRAIYGFGIGEVAKEGDLVTTSGYTEEAEAEYRKNDPDKIKSVPVGFEAKTLEDCKRMAVAFAKSVS